MEQRETCGVQAAVRLRQAIEQVADSLAHVELGGLLSSESALERALPGLTDLATGDAHERRAIRDELDLARSALSRCRTLGASLNDVVVRVTFEALGHDTVYGETRATVGRTVSDALAGRGFSARV